MTAHIARARCRCHADETSPILCDPCLEEIRAHGVADISPPPRNWRFIGVVVLIFTLFFVVMRWIGGAW
jgi:hypothetical protein